MTTRTLIAELAFYNILRIIKIREAFWSAKLCFAFVQRNQIFVTRARDHFSNAKQSFALQTLARSCFYAAYYQRVQCIDFWNIKLSGSHVDVNIGIPFRTEAYKFLQKVQHKC